MFGFHLSFFGSAYFLELLHSLPKLFCWPLVRLKIILKRLLLNVTAEISIAAPLQFFQIQLLPLFVVQTRKNYPFSILSVILIDASAILLFTRLD